jgi:hypothetical protein
MLERWTRAFLGNRTPPPLFALSVLVLLSLLIVAILFGALSSTGVVKSKSYELTGAAAGFFIVLYLLLWMYNKLIGLEEDNKKLSKIEVQYKNLLDEHNELKSKLQLDNPNMRIRLVPKSTRAKEAKFVECSYEIMDSKGKIFDKRENIKLTTDEVTRNLMFFIPLPMEIKYEYVTTITLTDDKGVKYPKSDNILSHKLYID